MPTEYVTAVIALPSGIILGALSAWYVLRRRASLAASQADAPPQRPTD